MTVPAIDGVLVVALGWGLIGLLWQAVFAHGLLVLCLRLVPVGRSGLRYLVALAALLALLAAPIATILRVASWPSPVPAASPGLIFARPPGAGSDAVPAHARDPAEALVPPGLSDNPAVAASVSEVVAQQPTAANAGASLIPSGTRPSGSAGWLAGLLSLGGLGVLAGRLSHYMWLLVAAWLVGVTVSMTRLAHGAAEARRLTRIGASSPPDWMRGTVDRLAAAVGIESVPVRASILAPAPMVVGALKPVVLVPTGAITRLTPERLEPILAHELVHVRHLDHLVNLLQSFVEALFFFHPSVLAIGKIVRQEREHCADAVTVRATGDPVAYVSALRELALTMGPGNQRLAATGGNLLNRVRRVLGRPEQPVLSTVLAAWLALVGGLLLAGAALASPADDDVAAQVIANPLVAQRLSGEDLEQLLRQAQGLGDEQRLALLLALVGRVHDDALKTALYIANANALPEASRDAALAALSEEQRRAATSPQASGQVETVTVQANEVPNYLTWERRGRLVLEQGFDLNRAGLAGRDLASLPAGRSLLYVDIVLPPDLGLDRTRVIERLDLSAVRALPGLMQATFGVLLVKFRGAGPIPIGGNTDFKLAELALLQDQSKLQGPWSLWVDEGNVVTANTSSQWSLPGGGSVVAPTPRQLVCLDGGVVVGGVHADWAFASDELFEQLQADCLGGRWGSDWNPVPPLPGEPVPEFELMGGEGLILTNASLAGKPYLMAFLAPVAEPPLVTQVGMGQTIAVPEPEPAVRFEQLNAIVSEAGVELDLVVVAAPYSHSGTYWSADSVASELRARLDVPVYEDPAGKFWLDFQLFLPGAGGVVLVDARGRLVEVFSDVNRLEHSVGMFGPSLNDALRSLAGGGQ